MELLEGLDVKPSDDTSLALKLPGFKKLFSIKVVGSKYINCSDDMFNLRWNLTIFFNLLLMRIVHEGKQEIIQL